jgi:mannose-6-phosphate isomerase
MSKLYPLQLIPEFVERVWGTHDLSFLYPHSVGSAPIGEVWLTGDDCRVANGALKGRTIAELCKEFGEAFTGANNRTPDRFPLLIKVLFPREKLSVQVHPDDEHARCAGEPCGKTECWYILKAEAGAQVGLGFRAGVKRDEIERAIHETRMEHLLNWIDVREGDLIYVDAGTVHAIAPGSVIVETQQNSDTTYRLYDYGRPRQLHVERGLEVMREQTHAGKVEREGTTLIASPCFTVERLALQSAHHSDTRQWSERGHVHCLVALDGAARIESKDSQPVTLARGDIAVVPASVGTYSVVPQWQCELLVASLPHENVPEPRTRLYDDAVVPAHSE